MEKSTRLNFNLPNSANDEIADINDISDNFRTLDNAELVTNKTGTIDVESTDAQYPTAKAVYEKFGNFENKIDTRFDKLNEKFSNALMDEKVGSMISAEGISPNVDSILVNVQPVSDTGLIERDVTEDTVIPIPNTTLFTFVAQAASSTTSTSKFVPYVNGAALLDAAVNTSAGIIPRDFNLTFKISGTKLNITGTKTYVYEETITENININVDVSSGAQLTGLAISGMASGEQDHVKIDARDKPSKVYKLGRNIFDPTPWTTAQTFGGITIQYLPDEDCFLFNGSSPSENQQFTVAIPNFYYGLNKDFTVDVEYVSGTTTQNQYGRDAVFHTGYTNDAALWGDKLHNAPLKNESTSQTKTCDRSYFLERTWFYVYAGVAFDNYKARIQVRCSDAAAGYGKYAAPAELTPDADGNVTAARENVCTFAVKTPGTLSAKYNRDINKAFDELKQAIISLGGNV